MKIFFTAVGAIIIGGCFFNSAPVIAQNNAQALLISRPQSTGGGGGPTYVSSGGDFTGGGTLSFAVTAGNRIIVTTWANDTSTGNTCSDGSNTYVSDATFVASGFSLEFHFFHVVSAASSTTLTITCTGVGAAVTAVQYSGGSGALDTAGTGTNPSGTSSTGSGSPLTPTAFTPTTAATILVDAYASLGGTVIVLNQVDASFTTRATCLNGGVCFSGGIGTRVVSSAASYTGGWSGTLSSDQATATVAYK